MAQDTIWQARTAMLVGDEALAGLAAAKVAVFGIGGVGGNACEALARAGVGEIHLFDDDVVSESNMNRQLVALRSTLGKPKVEVMAARIADINPDCRVVCHRVFYTPDTADEYPLDGYSYVVDAVDTVSAKIELVVRARLAGVPVISCMGAGNKLHPESFRVADLAKTSVCPLARVMRRELGRRGVKGVKVVYSKEEPLLPHKAAAAEPVSENNRPGKPKRAVPGSISFVPAAAGLVLAGEVVRHLAGVE